ncbi:VOC family protein [Veronia pacifica]|uniref:Glyoxalase n=1 Tax=Veronia pacifica TaxID=1080227 RepID=A0A1C3EJ78_9GAMM|nr:VOC family protein [Veronia pacifica]ODA33292.1 glyoxalase [Veronia pacifica]
MSNPVTLLGLRHLALKVHNLEECEAFYTDVLGMTLLRRANDNLVYLTCGNDNLSLSRARNQTDNKGSALDHFGFIVQSVSELEALYHYLAEQGAPLMDQIHQHTDGAWSFHCKDPAGNVIQPIYHPDVGEQVLMKE